MFTYDQENKFCISFYSNYFFSRKKFFSREKNDMFVRSYKSVNFFDLSSIQMLSTVISSIPFLEHNDANRMLMASTMQRQSLPLVFKQFPFVRTTLDYKLVFSSSSLCFLQSSVNIRYVNMFKLVLSKEFSKFSWFFNGFKKNWFYYKDEYFHLKSEKSNQDTYLQFNFLQLKNIWVNSNSLLSDNTSTYLGRLSFGRNFLIGYICWEGYNFEDAVVINEVLLINDLLSSLYLKKYRFFFTTSSFIKV